MRKLLFLCVLGASLIQVSPMLARKSSSSSLKHELKKCCKCTQQLIKSKLPCDAPFVIDTVPFIIDQPGKWCVIEELTYTGASAAIIVAASNVTINFSNYSLTLTDPAATGILVDGQSEVHIENDAISYTTRSSVPGSAAIHVRNSQKVSFDNLLINNAFQSFFFESSSDVQISNSRSTQAFNTHIDVSNCSDIAWVQSSAFNILPDFTNAGMVFRDTNGIILRNLDLFNVDIFVASQCNNGIFENINSLITDTAFPFSALQIGGSASTNLVSRDFIIRNCTINNRGFRYGIQNFKIDGLLIEDCVVENSTPTPTVNAGGIQIGGGGTVDNSVCRNVRIVNSVMKGGAFALFITGPLTAPSTGYVIENCQMHSALTAGIRISNTANHSIIGSVVKGCTISNNTGDGIIINNAASSNAIIENVICKNGGRGISIQAGAIQNNLQFNKIFSNGGIGIENNGTATEIYFNTSCNNIGTNCVNVAQAQAPNVVPVVTGSNICCIQALADTSTGQAESIYIPDEDLSDGRP